MEYESAAKNMLVLIALCMAAYFNIAGWHSAVFGWIVFLLYAYVLAGWARPALIKFFGLSHKAFRVRILAGFLSIATLGCVAGAFIVFYRLAAEHMALVLFLNGLLYLFIGEWAGKAKNTEAEMFDDKLDVLEEVPQPKIGVLLFLILAVIGFYLLAVSQSGGRLAAPWQAIGHDYIYVFLASVFLLGILIFSKLKTKVLLFLLVLLSLLLHSYLPLTHKLIYGADGWRHLAVEAEVVGERRVDITVYGPSESLVQKINPGRFSYSQLWGISTVLSRLLNAPLLAVNKWLLPVLWALVFPILLYEIGAALGWAKKESLLLAWFGLLPFAWQAAGSFTLPVNLGFLFFVFCVLLLLRRLKSARKEQAALLAVILFISVFSYILSWLFFACAWAAAEIINKCRSGAKGKWCVVLSVIAIAAFIPMVEVIFGYSKWDAGISWTGQIRQLAGNFSAYYLASGPRPHDITAGNVIFNQTPSYAFIANALTQWRWWLVIFSLALAVAAIAGIVSMLRRRESEHIWLAALAAGILGGYIISNYFLGGEHLLGRRLDNLFALALIIPAFYFCVNFIFRRIPGIWSQVIFVAIVALAIAASYSLGPDTQTATADEYAAAGYIWQTEKFAGPNCILGDTYFLLALEAQSEKKIIGGGFPIDQNFGQPDRTALFVQMKNRISVGGWLEALHLTGAGHCWLALDINDLKKQGLLNGAGYKLFGDAAVLRYN